MIKSAAGLIIFVCLAILGSFIAQSDFSLTFQGAYGSVNNLSSVFFSDSVTEESLRLAYAEASKKPSRRKENEKVKILVVPGHDKDYSGTAYRGLNEVELTVDVAEKLYALLSKEPAFDVRITQTKAGYEPEFASYFENNRDSIQKFIDTQKGLMNYYVQTGEIETRINMIHNTAPGDVAIKLYGINKWANENGSDIVIHAHFNDNPRKNRSSPGQYSGFAIYVPESQFSNAKGSKSVAQSIYERLFTAYPKSDLPKEGTGIVEDQELIAIGSYNSLDAASMLIEYGYIYEPPFTDPALRDTVLSDLALQTYLGIAEFFGIKTAEGGEFKSRFLPYVWQTDLRRGQDSPRDILSLQAVLLKEGLYPPPGETKNDCSLTGHFGPCTERSVQAFQVKYGISPAEGFVGEQTRAKLNELYGQN